MTNSPSRADYWGISALLTITIFGIVAIVSWSLGWHWLYTLWYGYAWSSDKGNGPEALQQTIAYAAIAIVFVPVVRKFIKREFDRVHTSIHIHGQEAQAHLQHISDKMGLRAFEHTEEYKEHIAKR